MAVPIRSQMPLQEIDPFWAWQAWQPSDVEPWDARRAAHLFRRAGFCASEDQLKSATESDPQVVLDSLLAPSSEMQPTLQDFESESDQLARAVLATGDIQQLAVWWLHRMRYTPMPLIEKMTLFWHGHFATGAEKVLDVELMQRQNQLLREHAVGDLQALVHGIAKDPAMLIYLDSASNRKAHANENFARELMELFCLGEGNYTESDVQQLARCFTGWEIRRKQYRFNPYQHDTGEKSVLGQQVKSGEQAIDVVLDHGQLPTFIASKLFRFFVADEPSPSPALLEPLAKKLRDDNLRLDGMLRMLLGSRLLLSDWSFGRKIRSPIEMIVGLLRSMNASANLVELANRVRETGQGLFFPPNVKGWDGARAWINSSTLVGRANLIHAVVRDENTRFGDGALGDLFRRRGDSVAEFSKWFAGLYQAVAPTPDQVLRLEQAIEDMSEQESARNVLSLMATMPQFHLA